jgi:hypothetical protein
MKKKQPNLQRQMWTKEQDMLLTKIVKEHNYSNSLSWNNIATLLNAADSKIEKSGKQCRERYMNYLEVSITSKKWSKEEKVLFVLLHNEYGNRWSEIAKFYPERNDPAMKNYFYIYLRKVLKEAHNRLYSSNIACKPWEVLTSYYMINLIHTYLPKLQKEYLINPPSIRGTTILSIIATSGLDAATLSKLKTELIQKFKRNRKSSKLPITIWLHSNNFLWSSSNRIILNDLINKQNLNDLSPLLRIDITSDSPKQVFSDPNLPHNVFTQFPYHIPSSIFHSPIARFPYPVSTSPMPITPPSSQILFDEEVKVKERSENGFSEEFNKDHPISLPQYYPIISPINLTSVFIYPLYTFNTQSVPSLPKQWGGLGRELERQPGRCSRYESKNYTINSEDRK